MSSAARLMTKSARKIHSDQYPRRLARKVSSRLFVSGVIRSPTLSNKFLSHKFLSHKPSLVVPAKAGTHVPQKENGAPACAGATSCARTTSWELPEPHQAFLASRLPRTSSGLPRFEVDAGIDEGVGQVADEVHQEAEEREEEERAEHDRIVAVDGRLEAEQAQAVEREDHLDQHRAGEEDADERRRESGDDDEHGVAEDVAIEHPPL